MVHAVTFGDADLGHPVPEGKTAQPLHYHGQPVLSRRNDSALETIALRTDGSIVRLGLASGDLGTLYRTKIEPAARQRRQSARLADRVERFPLFLIAGLTFLMAACWPARRGWAWFWTGQWNLRWLHPGRKRAIAALLIVPLSLALNRTRADLRRPGRASLRASREPMLARTEPRPPHVDVAAHAAGSLGAGDTPARIESESAAEAVARGQAAYELGRWDQALAEFNTAVELAPTSAIPRYNAAATLFQLGRYHDAQVRYLEARERAGSFLRTKIDYALGNTALAQRDIPARSAGTTSALPRPRRARASRLSAAMPRSIVNSPTNGCNRFLCPKIRAQATGRNHRIPTGGSVPTNTAKTQTKRRKASPRAMPQAAARLPRPRRMATGPLSAESGEEELAVDTRGLQEREQMPPTTSSMPRSKISARPRTGVCPKKSRLCPRTAIVRTGEPYTSESCLYPHLHSFFADWGHWPS